MEYEKKIKRSLPDDEESSLEISPESKRLRSDILEIFEDDGDESLDKGSETESTAEEMLNSVMKSLQEEIDGDAALSGFVDVSELPDLGYLLGASDDELGLPPACSDESVSEHEDVPTEILSSPASEVADLAGFWEFDDLINGYGMAEFGFPGIEESREEEEHEHVVFEGLFDFTEASFPANFASVGFLRPESSPSV